MMGSVGDPIEGSVGDFMAGITGAHYAHRWPYESAREDKAVTMMRKGGTRKVGTRKGGTNG